MSLEFRIEKKDAFRVVGVVTSTSTENNAGMTDVPALWGKVIQEEKHLEIMGLMNQSPFGLMGVSVYNTDPTDSRKFDYYIVCSSDKQIPEGMVEYTVPAATWAIFPCKRTEISDIEVRVVTEWQLESGYEVINSGYETGVMKSQAPDMEVHGQDDNAEVWVAVRKR
ncbi:MAG: GyrI-like domain-containing protein [Clostridia bacterium]